MSAGSLKTRDLLTVLSRTLINLEHYWG